MSEGNITINFLGALCIAGVVLGLWVTRKSNPVGGALVGLALAFIGAALLQFSNPDTGSKLLGGVFIFPAILCIVLATLTGINVSHSRAVRITEDGERLEATQIVLGAGAAQTSSTWRGDHLTKIQNKRNLKDNRFRGQLPPQSTPYHGSEALDTRIDYEDIER